MSAWASPVRQVIHPSQHRIPYRPSVHPAAIRSSADMGRVHICCLAFTASALVPSHTQAEVDCGCRGASDFKQVKHEERVHLVQCTPLDPTKGQLVLVLLHLNVQACGFRIIESIRSVTREIPLVCLRYLVIGYATAHSDGVTGSCHRHQAASPPVVPGARAYSTGICQLQPASDSISRSLSVRAEESSCQGAPAKVALISTPIPGLLTDSSSRTDNGIPAPAPDVACVVGQ